MSFPRAKIQRFNETPSCSPAPGTYDPKLDTRVKGPTMRKETKLGSEGDLTTGIPKSFCSAIPVFRTPQLPRKAVKVTGKTQSRERTDSSSSSEDLFIKGKEISSSCPDLTDLESLKYKLKDAIDEVNKFKDLCDMLNKDISLKMTQIEDLQHRNENLVSEIALLQIQLEEAQNKHHQSLSEFESLDQDTLKSIKEIYLLVDELNNQKDISSKEMLNLRSELDNLASLKHDLEQKVGQKQQMILLLQSELSTAEVELMECRSECERINSVASDRSQEIESLQNTIKDLEKKMEEADKQLRDMRDNLMNGSVVRENLEELLTEKQTEYLFLEEKYSELVTECELLKAKHDREVEEVKQSYDAQLNCLVNNLELASNITQLNTSHFQNLCDEKLSILENSMEFVVAKAEGIWQNTITHLKDNLNEVSHQLQEERAIAEKKIELMTLEMEKRDYDSSKRIKEVESEARIITEKLLCAEEQLKKLNDIKDELKISDVENKITIVELQDKIDVLIVENSSISSKMTVIVEERDSLKTQNKKLTVGNRNLSGSLEALRVRLLESEADVEELTNFKKSLESEKENLKLNLEIKLKELEELKRNMIEIEKDNLQQIEKVREELLEKLEFFKKEASNHSENLHKVQTEKQLQIQDLSSQLTHFQHEFNELNKYVSTMEQENKNQSLQLEQYEIKHSELEESYETLSTRLKHLETELNKRSSDLFLANGKISAQEEQILEYKCNIEQLTADIETSKSRLIELNEALTVAEESSAEHEREIEALTEKLDHQRDCAKVATQQIASLEARNSYQDHQIQSISSELERHKEFSHQATEHMLSLVNSNAEKENQIASLSEELEEMKINLKEANDKLCELKSELSLSENKLTESLEEIKLLEGDRFVKEEHLKELTLDLEQNKRCCEKYQEQVNDLESKNLEKEKQLDALKLKLVTLEEEKHADEVRHSELISKMEQSMKINNTQSEKLFDELSDIKSHCHDLKKIKADLELEIHELSRKCNVLECSLLEEKSTNMELLNQIAHMEEDISRNQSERAILQHNCDKQKSQVEALQAEMKNLNLQLDNKQDEMMKSIAKLKEQLLVDQENVKRVSELEKESLEWQKRYLEVESLIGPFKEQLEAYRAECKLLEAQKGEVLDDMRELALQYAATLGHQNHKQKIRYLVKIKEQNLELKEEVRSLKRVIEKLRKENASSSGKPSVVTHTALVSKGKENVGHNNSPVRKSPVASPNPKPFADRPAHKNVI